jgi:hypothetical protein
MSYLNHALRMHEFGANVTGTVYKGKRPPHNWKEWEATRQTEADVKGFVTSQKQAPVWQFATGYGAISGINGWRYIDIDDSPGPAPARQLLDRLGLPSDYRWLVKSGSHKGWGIWLRCDDPLPAQVLASDDNEPGVFWLYPQNGNRPLFDHIELRWENCQTLLPPSKHPTGPGYEWVNGPPEGPPAVVTISNLLAALLSLAIPKQEPTKKPKPPRTRPIDGDRPGDRYNAECAGEALELLERAGGEEVYERGGVKHLRRPGKKRGTSATFNYGDSNCFHCFTSNWPPFEHKQSYKPFAIYTLLEHGGDYQAAAAALAKRFGMNGQDPPQRSEATAQPYEYKLPEAALAEKDRIEAENAAAREAKEARLKPVFKADVIPFIIFDENEYIKRIVSARANFTNAREWAEFIEAHYPELDPLHEYAVKLAENREDRVSFCGKALHRTDATGCMVRKHAMCGCCEKCKEIDRANLRRFIGDNLLAEGEDIIMLEVPDKRTRALWTRRCRMAGVAYKAYAVCDGYHILMAGAIVATWPEVLDIGQFVDRVDLTDDLLNAWHLIPSKNDLRALYREKEKYEVVMPEMVEVNRVVIKDRDGEIQYNKNGTPKTRAVLAPKDPDIITVFLPGVFADTDYPPAPLPVAPVYDLQSLQAALDEIGQQLLDRTVKQGHVVYGVSKKKMYTSNVTLPELIKDFNAQQEALRQAKTPQPA